MRTFAVATLLGATLGLAGCGATPSDPYANMPMLAPERAGAGQAVQEDPVLRAERAYNAQFAHPAGSMR